VALADGLATTLMVLEPQEGRALLRDFEQCDACLITKSQVICQG